MPNIHLCLFAYGLPDDLMAAFTSVNQTEYTWHLFLHSRIPAVIEVCEYLATAPNVVYRPYGTNRGGARSLNEGLLSAQDRGADVFIVWQDDLYGTPQDIERTAKCVITHPDCSFVESVGYVERTGRDERLALTGGAINLKAIEKIGYFDQNFWPMYFDDTDWMYRAKLAGLSSVLAQGVYLRHAGSKTHTHVQPEAFDSMFYPNKEYYIAKNGGDSGAEQYVHPFNDPSLSYKIERANVASPYPGHQWREAQE